jgi:hypothetical protein
MNLYTKRCLATFAWQSLNILYFKTEEVLMKPNQFLATSWHGHVNRIPCMVS